MADSFRLLLILVLTGVAASDLTKMKSNPDGNFAIGFKRGYINSGKYGVIVPKGDVDEKREVQIRGAAWDSVTMAFNAQTIVFSDWSGMFMLGDKVYTDKLGTLYFVRSDKKCVRKVYKRQMGEMQVIEKENLDRIVCEAIRTKVENAVSHFLTSPFKYLLPSASDKLKRTPGFPGGDFFLGLKHGEITCGQHTLNVPTGDENKPKVIKITAPGVSDEIKMVFDSDTKVFGSWDGVLYLGDKVFSVQPKTLVIKKDDGSCIKKYYATKGSEVVTDRSVLLKQEDCFLIKSKAYGAMQKLRKPSMSSDDNRGKKKKNNKKSSKSSDDSSDDQKKGSSSRKKMSGKSSKGTPPPPIHVTSTVIIPKQNQQTQPTVQKFASPSAVILPVQNSPAQPQLVAIQGTQPQSYYVQNNNGQQPAVILQPLNEQTTPPNDILLAGPDKIVNIQNNDIDMNTLGEPITIQNIDPNQQVMIPQGYVRVGRSISESSRRDNVLNTQILDVDASAIETARKGQSDTKIVGVQKSNIITPNTVSDMKTTQITTVTLPSDEKDTGNYKGSSDKKTSQDIFVDTNVIVDQGSQPVSNTNSITVVPSKSPPITVIPTKSTPITVVPAISTPVAVSSGSKTVNLQKNDVTLGQKGSVINIQKNVVKLHNRNLPTTFIPVVDETNPPPVLVRIGRSIQSTDSNNVINVQDNLVNSVGSGDVKNIQMNKVNIESQTPTYVVSPKGPIIAYDIQKPKRVLNFQTNLVNEDGITDVKNIQTNNVGLGSSDAPLVLQTKAGRHFVNPKAIVQRISPSITASTPNAIYVANQRQEATNVQKNDVTLDGPGDVKNFQKNRVNVDSPDYFIARTALGPKFIVSSPKKVLNLQDNEVDLDGEGDVRNVQMNDVIQNEKPTILLAKRRKRNISQDVLNVQKNDVTLEGPGDVKNYQKNRVNVDSPDYFIASPALGPKLIVSAPKKVLNLQNNEVDLDGVGDVRNVQINDVIKNEKPTILLAKRRKRNIPQDVLNNQIVNVDGAAVASSVSQGGKILSLQGNDILVPTGPDGSVIMPNMKSTQVTRLTLPPHPGTSPSQPPQKMYIKTNVMYKQNPQQSQTIPMYVQSSPSNSNGPTFVQVVPSSQPQVVVSQQAPAQTQTFYVSSTQPSILVPASSLQSQSNQKPVQSSYVLANGAATVSSQVHPGGVVHTIRQQNGGATSYTLVHTPTPPSSQGRIPVTLMKDLTMLKKMYNPSNMIVNIAQNTNFHKK